MKLYSRSQLIKSTLAGVAAGVVIALAGAAYLTFTPKSEPEDSESKAESNSEVKESSQEKLEISKVENSAVQADSYYHS